MANLTQTLEISWTDFQLASTETAYIGKSRYVKALKVAANCQNSDRQSQQLDTVKVDRRTPKLYGISVLVDEMALHGLFLKHVLNVICIKPNGLKVL